MQQQRTKDTAPEVALRRELHRRGLRYRLHRRVLPGLSRSVDIVFVSVRVAVDVRGCFWHACPAHCRRGSGNADWWSIKLSSNAARDVQTEALLRAAGWAVVVVWEHDRVEDAADQVEALVRQRSHLQSLS